LASHEQPARYVLRLVGWCVAYACRSHPVCGASVPKAFRNAAIGADHLVAARYVAEALGLGYVPPMTLLEAARRADVLLGDIDYRGVRGWQAANVLLASALTEWRIRLKRIASSPAWRFIDAARVEGRSVPAEVTSRLPKGLSVSIYGLHALLPTGQVRGIRRGTPADDVAVHLRQLIGEHIQVVPLRLDSDAGRIYVSERNSAERQLALPLNF